jgi:hypothetical protein
MQLSNESKHQTQRYSADMLSRDDQFKQSRSITETDPTKLVVSLHRSPASQLPGCPFEVRAIDSVAVQKMVQRYAYSAPRFRITVCAEIIEWLCEFAI